MKKKVLCVCVKNTCRSVMMAEFLKKELGDEFIVESAGVCERCTGRPAGEYVIYCMKEKGVDISGHESRHAGDLNLSLYSHIVCADGVELDPMVLFLSGFKGEVITMDDSMPDPRGAGLLVHQARRG